MESTEAAGRLGNLRLENKEELREARQLKMHPNSYHRNGLVRIPLLVSPPVDIPSELPKLGLYHLAVLHLCQDCQPQGGVAD